MSDACYLEIAFRNEDEKRLRKIIKHAQEDGDSWFYDDILVESSFWKKVFISQANYGLDDELTQASKEGLVFYGISGEGGGYHSTVYVSFAGKFHGVLDRDGWPAIRMDEHLNLMEADIKEAKMYYQMLGLAKKYIEEGPDANSGSQPQA